MNGIIKGLGFLFGFQSWILWWVVHRIINKYMYIWWFLYNPIRLLWCMNIDNLRRGLSPSLIPTIVINRFRRRISASSFLMRMFRLLWLSASSGRRQRGWRRWGRLGRTVSPPLFMFRLISSARSFKRSRPIRLQSICWQLDNNTWVWYGTEIWLQRRQHSLFIHWAWRLIHNWSLRAQGMSIIGYPVFSAYVCCLVTGDWLIGAPWSTFIHRCLVTGA